MELRVLYNGVPVGTTELPQLSGLAHGMLVPSDGYEAARPRAEAAGRDIWPRGPLAWRYWPMSAGDYADVVASRVASGFELEDSCGLRVSVASVVLLTRELPATTVAVVADFRPQSAHALAGMPDTHGDGGGRRRPAA